MAVLDRPVAEHTDKARRNAEYLAKIDRGFKDAEAGRVIVFEDDDWMTWTPEQLKAYADEQRAHWPQ
ncbi:MAG: hypothetical protein LBS86_06630 [Treponema sp.]|jgi:predicted transcriptional regulator|nr:hypothetical protein [Treponema sp.]